MRTELSPSLSTKSLKKLALLATTMLIGLGATHAQAQDYGYDPNANYGSSEQAGSNPDSALPSNLKLTVAVGVGAAPEYFGSDDYEAIFTPAIDLEYQNAFLVYDRQAMMQTYEGLGYKILSNDNWALGISLLYDQGRDDDSDHIRGMGEIDGTAMAGGFVAYQYGPAFARAQLHMDVLDEYDGGYRGELGAGVRGQLMPYLKGMLETTARYGSDNYNEQFFNVSAAQSARTGLARYDADDGFYQWGLGGTLQYNITPGAFVQGVARYDRVMGDAADSSVSESDNQFFLGTNVGYQF